jgi:hypothetical protein
MKNVYVGLLTYRYYYYIHNKETVDF